jgi:hypothetical protein
MKKHAQENIHASWLINENDGRIITKSIYIIDPLSSNILFTGPMLRAIREITPIKEKALSEKIELLKIIENNFIIIKYNGGL